jgi:hypothetical protein
MFHVYNNGTTPRNSGKEREKENDRATVIVDNVVLKAVEKWGMGGKDVRESNRED